MPGYGQIDRDYAIKLATTAPADDGPVWMINLMCYKERAEYTDGRETTLSGRQADEVYTPVGPLAAVGAEIVFVADVEDQLIGDEPKWDRIAVVRYSTRASFIAMQEREDFQTVHEHKEAGMDQTIVIGGQPLGCPVAEQQVAWADVPHPPSEEDGAYTMLHVIRFHDEAGATVTPDHMKSYQEVAGSVAVPNGVRIDGWFSAEGTIIGDGRSWHQVRFNTFPSRRAFMTVALDPDRTHAHTEHRDTAIADTYALGLRPSVNTLAASVGEIGPPLSQVLSEMRRDERY
ncbi:MAG: hypothetical protein OXH61_13580 [Acidimicrobiaceae bacterium]|nr:hypothetical protein [Acidimicrobiaceae bacterium]